MDEITVKNQYQSSFASGLHQTTHAKSDTLHDFLQDSPLNHQLSTEYYRAAVKDARKLLYDLDNDASSRNETEISDIKEEIENLTNKLSNLGYEL